MSNHICLTKSVTLGNEGHAPTMLKSAVFAKDVPITNSLGMALDSMHTKKEKQPLLWAESASPT